MADAKAIGYLELNCDSFNKSIAQAKVVAVSFASFWAGLKIEKFLENGTKEAIKLGESMYQAGKKLGNFDPGQLFLVQKALQEAGLSAGEAQGKIDEFVTSGMDLSQLFHGGAGMAGQMAQAAKEYGSEAAVLSKSAKDFHDAFATLESIGNKVKVFFLAAAAEFVKPLNAVLQMLDQIDLAGIGDSFGKAIADGANILIGLIKTGDFWTAFKLGLQVAFETAINVLVSGFKYAVEVLSASVNALFSENFFNILVDGFTGVGSKITSILMDSFKTPIAWYQAKIESIGGKFLQSEVDVKRLTDLYGEKEGKQRAQRNADFYGIELNHKPQSYEEILRGYKKEPATLLGKTSSDYSKKGDDYLAKLKPELASLAETIKGIASSTKMESTDLFAGLGDTEKKLSDIINNSKLVGQSMGVGSRTDNVNRIAATTSPEPFRIVADSLARVGGGGGYMRIGQTLQEREMVKQTRAQEAMEKLLDVIASNTGERKSGRMNTMPSMDVAY